MTPHLTLPAELTIYTAAQTRQAWLDALMPATDGPLQALADGVAEIDGAGVQLLVSLQNWSAAQQRPLRLLQASDVVRSACERAGLHTMLATGDAA